MMTQALDHQATRLHDSGRVARAARVARIVGWWAAFEGWVRLLLAAAGTFHACWRNLSPMVISRSITHIRRFLDLLQTHFITHLHKSHSMNDRTKVENMFIKTSTASINGACEWHPWRSRPRLGQSASGAQWSHPKIGEAIDLNGDAV
jgi:hypothetical protein